MQDTFWLKDGHLLRTHTSPVQVRGMERLKPPLRMIAPGRVFRNESTDPSHEHTFYQLEGMMVDREVSIAHMLYFMKTLLKAIFGRDVEVRLRPGFFPFVEPGFELDIRCLICGGSGCPVCKQSGWVELLPCGLVNPNVLRFSGLDPEEWNGFAFGLGLTRLVMMRYGIDDIRYLQSGDLRFLRQFR
jgi:phenylalanyl-tRNA synthetase alpha chain